MLYNVALISRFLDEYTMYQIINPYQIINQYKIQTRKVLTI